MRGPVGAEGRPSRTGWAILVGVVLVLPTTLVGQALLDLTGADRLATIQPQYLGIGAIILVRGLAGFLAGAALTAALARLFPAADFGEVVFWQSVVIILAAVLILLATAVILYIAPGGPERAPPWSVAAIAVGYVCGGAIAARFVARS